MIPNLDPKAFWQSLEAAEAKRRELAKVTHEMTAKKQARVAANDEPEPAVVLAEGVRG